MNKRRLVLAIFFSLLCINISIDAEQVQCGCPNGSVTNLVTSLDNTFAACCGEERLLLTALDDLVNECCQTVSLDIQLTLSSLPNLSMSCTEFIPDFNLCCSIINENFQSTFSIIATLGDECRVTPVTTATTISAPGTYCLNNDIVGNISIASDRVTLDLNGHVVTGEISMGTNFLIRIKNGFITNSFNGVFINNADGVILEDINIFDCPGTAIRAIGAGFVTIDRITIDSCGRGIEYGSCTTSSINECVLTNISSFGIVCANCARVSILNTYISNIAGIVQVAVGIEINLSDDFFIDNCVVENVVATGTQSAIGIRANSAQHNIHISGCDVKQIVTDQGDCLGIELFNTPMSVVRNCRVLNLTSAASIGRVQGFSVVTGFGNVFIENECSNIINGGISALAAGFGFQTASGTIIDRCTASNLTNAVGFLVSTSATPDTTAIFNECNVTSITGTTTLFDCYQLNDGIGVVNRCTADDCIGVGFKVSGGISAATEWTVVRSMAINGDIGFEKPTSVSADPAGMYNVAGLCNTNFSNWPFVDPVGRQIACPADSGPQIGYNAEG